MHHQATLQQQPQLPNLTHFQQQRAEQQSSQQLPGAYPHRNRTTPFGLARARLNYFWEVKQLYLNNRNMNQYHHNPVGALQERYQSRGIQPQYRVVQAEGASHCPIFSYEVFVGEYVAIGSGSSKKQAKHNAARAMLNKLDGRLPPQEMIVPPVSLPTTTVNSSCSPSVDLNKSDASSMSSGVTASTTNLPKGNTIGYLQEMCVQKGLPMPAYNLDSSEGQPHQRAFVMQVRVGSFTAKGNGTSKKDAKREAAERMIAILQEGVSPEEVIVKCEERDTVTVDLVKKMETLKVEDSKNIQQFYQGLRQGDDSKLAALNRTPLKSILGGDYMAALKEIANEQQFEVTHVDVDERTEDGEVQYLVQISSLPVAVCYGVGSDREAAIQNAAKYALAYLKLMTKKTSSSATNGKS